MLIIVEIIFAYWCGDMQLTPLSFSSKISIFENMELALFYFEVAILYIMNYI